MDCNDRSVECARAFKSALEDAGRPFIYGEGVWCQDLTQFICNVGVKITPPLNWKRLGPFLVWVAGSFDKAVKGSWQGWSALITRPALLLKRNRQGDTLGFLAYAEYLRDHDADGQQRLNGDEKIAADNMARIDDYRRRREADE